MAESIEAAHSLLGNIEVCNRQIVAGWAFDPQTSGSPVLLEIFCNDQFVGTATAARFRSDLKDAGYLGAGNCAFECEWPFALGPGSHVVNIRRAADGTNLPGSPCTIPALTSQAERHAWLSTNLAAMRECGQPDDLESEIGYLVGELGLLLSHRAKLSHGDRPPHNLKARWGDLVPDERFVRPRSHIRLSALFIDEYLPTINSDAGSNAVLDHIRSMLRLGFQIYFVAFKEISITKDRASQLIERGVTVLGAPWYVSVEEILSRHADLFDVIYLHRGPTAALYAGMARHYCPRAMRIYSVADLHYLRLLRKAITEGNSVQLGQVGIAQFEELTAARTVHAVITHSEVEADLLRQKLPKINAMVIPWSVQVRATATPFKQREGVAFIGNFSHQPNMDALFFIVSTIVPMLRRQAPQLSIKIIGSNMPARLFNMRQPNLEVVGHIDNLSDIFDQVRLTFAPLRYGAGLKGKVIESLAAGVPCVGTPIAYEGIKIPSALKDCVALTAEGMLAALKRFYYDEVAHMTVSVAGQRYASTTYSDVTIDTQFHNLLLPVLQKWGGVEF